MLQEGSKKAGTLWACPGYLSGIVATGGRRQVMFTLLRPELPKASIKPLNLHLAQSPKITTRAAYLI